MTQRIPNTASEVEVRQGFQRLVAQNDVITTGASGYILVGQGIGTAPVWQILSSAIDHGGLGGLGDDDHTIYSLADGTRAFSGVVVGVDPVNSNHLATKEYVDSAISFIQEFFLTDAASGVGSYFNMVDQHTGLPESSDPTGSITQDDDQPLTEWITVVNFPTITDLEHGIYSVHINVEKTGAGARDVRIYFEVWTRTHPGGTEVLRTTSEVSDLITSRTSIDLHATLAADIAINETDRIVVKFFANGVSGGGDATITLYSEGTTSSHFSMPTSSEVLSTIFLRQDGTKALTGNMAVDGGITIDGRDLSVDGTKLDTVETNADVTDATNVAAAGAAMSGGAFHDGFSDSVANEHIDHTGVSIATAATSGISGGGTIAATRNLALNINGLTGESAIAGGDTLPFYDTTAGASRKITFTELTTALGGSDEKVGVDSGATPDYLGATAGAGALRLTSGLKQADGGNFITLSLDVNGLAALAIAADDTIPFWSVLGSDNKKITFANLESTLNIGNLFGYDANKYVDHTGVSISTSTGLTGGGDLTTTRTLSLSHLGIESLTNPGADRILFWDNGGSVTGWLAVTGTSGVAISGTNLEINAGYVDRGDPAAFDRAFGDFTFDNTDWYDLDLGSGGLGILPSGAYAVHIRGYIKGTAGNQYVFFRKNGNSNEINIHRAYTGVNGIYFYFDCIIAVDGSGVIEYKGHGSLDECVLVVGGWYI